MINGKDTDIVENKMLIDVSSKIKHLFYKLGFVPFTWKCLNDPLVRRELDGNSNKNEILKKKKNKVIT